MATTPDAGVDLSDTDLDELVAEAAGDETTSTTDPEPDPSAPAADAATDDAEHSAPDDSLASTVADEDADEQAGRPAADDEEDIPLPAAPAAPAPLDVSQGKPFQFKASGAEHTLAGALELPDGSVVIPKDAQAEFRRTLANERDLAANFTKYRRESDRKLTTLQKQRTDKDVQADHLASLFDAVLQMTPDERYEWAEKLDADRPRIELEIRQKQLDEREAAFKREQQGPEPTPEERQEQHVQAVLPHLDTVFRQLMASPEAKALTKDEATLIYNRYAKNPRRLLGLIRTATEDYPTEGIKKGDAYLDPEDIKDDFETAIRLKPKGTTTPAETRNAALNADKPTTGKAATPIPPAMRTGGKVVATPGTKKTATFSRDAFMKGELDDD